MTETAGRTSVVRTEDGRTALRIERPLRHPAEKVWRALTEPGELNGWFPFDVEPELRVGGRMRFVEKDGSSSSTGTVTELEPGRVIAYTWEDDHLRWELAPLDTGCLLVLTHTVPDHYGTASFATGWHACLDAMVYVLAGRPVREPEPEDVDATHERFVVELGLVEATVREGAEGWVVRLERQLVRPAEVAWRALVDGAEPAVRAAAPRSAVPERLQAGGITEVKANELLEYEWLAGGAVAGAVRIELGPGTGQGARLVITQSGRADHRSARSAEVWTEFAARLAARLVATPRR